MTPDHWRKIRQLSEQLVEVALQEADPTNWPGAGKTPRELSRDERGDRVWTKRDAFATLAIVNTLQRLTGVQYLRTVDPLQDRAADEGDLDAELDAAEREAEKILEQFQQQGFGRTR